MGATGAVGVTAGGLGLALSHQHSEYTQLEDQARVQAVSAQSFATTSARGAAYARATDITLVVFAAAAVATGVMIPFVNWYNLPSDAP